MIRLPMAAALGYKRQIDDGVQAALVKIFSGLEVSPLGKVRLHEHFLLR